MPEIFVGEEHVQVYHHWVATGARLQPICRVDFHCDLRGLLVDHRRHCAYRIDSSDRRMSDVDSGNFLAHAVMEGRVSRVRWIHDPHGGRRHDVGTVKYRGDLTAQPHRFLHWLRGAEEVDFRLEELDFEQWQGPEEGENLDIDWDGIASIEYEPAFARKLMDRFLDVPWTRVPEEVYVVRSPGYSLPDADLHAEFLERLQAKLGAGLSELPRHEGPRHRAEAVGWREKIENRVVLGLKRIGIH